MSRRFGPLALLVLLLAGSSGAGSLGPRLRYLSYLVDSGRVSPAPDRVAVTLVVDPRFDPGAAARAGATLTFSQRAEDAAAPRLLRTRQVVPALAPLAAAAALAALDGVEQVETSWFPRQPPPPLYVSCPQIESPLVWPERDSLGLPLTGAGVLIADFDTGVDVFHPHFFHPDGGRFDWIDIDRSGGFTAGTDAVDLDRGGTASAGETLRVLEANLPVNNPRGYDPDVDWLYADTNGNGRRDHGRTAGFDDRSPGFGEPLLVVDDVNGNGRLDTGEPLVELGTSKIRAVREKDGRVRRRGVDLIDTEPDAPIQHGTWVAGILLGGIAGLSHYAGQAPEAELIVADMYYPSLPPFEDDMGALALWAKDEGARVMLYESGNWVWSYLDGSSGNELTMSDLAREGFLQVTPTGNLTGGGQQQTTSFPSGQPGSMSITTPGGVAFVWPSLLWQGMAADATVTMTLPGGGAFAPCYCARAEVAGNFSIYSDRSTSIHGTTMLNYELRSAGGGNVSGTFTFRVTPARDLTVLGYSWDDQSGWSGQTRWNQADNIHTVTQPATGDVSLAIGAYDPRGGTAGEGGAINGFSGRGTRIDGVSVLDLATPGSVVDSTCPVNRCGEAAISGFGGTSSALPHATGAAALLVQLNPHDPHEVIERLLKDAALADSWVGAVPNDTWGMGKLRLRRAYEAARKPSLLRDDSVTTLSPLTPGKATLFPADGDPTSLRLTGPNRYSHEGEGNGATLSTPGSTDGDAFLIAHVDPGVTDPEGTQVIADAARPLILYELTGAVTMKLVKAPSGVAITY